MSNPDKPSAHPNFFKNWAGVPRRCAGDERFKDRHFRVLIAICVAVNSKTGMALISQKRIGELAQRHRNTVGPAIRDLAEWGYLKTHKRGRQKTGLGKGRFRTYIYEIIYDRPDFSPAQAGPVASRAQPELYETVHTKARADSNFSGSDFNAGYLGASAARDGGTFARQMDGTNVAAKEEHSNSASDEAMGHTKLRQEETASIDDNINRLFKALQQAAELEDVYEESKRLGVSLDSLSAMQQARKQAAKVVPHHFLAELAPNIPREGGSTEEYVRRLTQAYQALIDADVGGTDRSKH